MEGLWNQLALVHAKEGHRLVLRKHGKKNARGRYMDAAFFFIDPKTGLQFSDASYRAMFKAEMRERLGVEFAPKLCRNIFATALLAGDSIEGLSVEGVANLMGNSAPTLKLHYDKGYHYRQGRLAAERMEEWLGDVQRAGNDEAESSSGDEGQVALQAEDSIEVCLSHDDTSYCTALSSLGE